MKDNHLTEEDLQAYVTDLSILPAVKLSHVADCRQCQEEIEAYQLIISVINEQPAFRFDIDLSAVVLEKIHPEKEKKFKKMIVPMITIIGALVPVYFLRQKNFFYFFSGVSEFMLVACAFLFSCVLIVQALQLYSHTIHSNRTKACKKKHCLPACLYHHRCVGDLPGDDDVRAAANAAADAPAAEVGVGVTPACP